MFKDIIGVANDHRMGFMKVFHLSILALTCFFSASFSWFIFKEITISHLSDFSDLIGRVSTKKNLSVLFIMVKKLKIKKKALF